MLISQMSFPALYDVRTEVLLHKTSEELKASDSTRFNACVQKHTRLPFDLFHSWARSAPAEKVLGLVTELLGYSLTGIAFTGYRVTVSIISGRPNFTFELFAKNPGPQKEALKRKEINRAKERSNA